MQEKFERKCYIYGKTSKEFVNGQHFTSTTDIMNNTKELFIDVPQTVMKARLEEKLGYEKSERVSCTPSLSIS